MQPFLAVSVGQKIECRFLAHWPSIWQRMHRQSLYTVNDQEIFSCWNASASITALQYPASLFLIYAVTPPHFALAGILCMKSKEACAHRWQKEGYTFQYLHERTYLLHISYSTQTAYLPCWRKKEKLCFSALDRARLDGDKNNDDLRGSRHMAVGAVAFQHPNWRVSPLSFRRSLVSF